MRVIETIGNIFRVKSKIPAIVMITPVLLAFITTLLKLFLANQPLINEFSLENIIWPFIAYSIFIIFKKRESLKGIITYFRPNLISIIFITVEIVLSAIWWFIFKETAFKYVVVILWLISGFLRILIQKTPALFYYDITKLLHINEIYGFTRASTYFLVTLYFLSAAQSYFNNFYFSLIIFIPFITIYFFYISNLYPYMVKHIDVRRSIEILRYIGDNNPSRNALLNGIHISEQNLDESLRRLQISNYIEKIRKYKLKKEYVKIRDSL
jgi:hypothetical protein